MAALKDIKCAQDLEGENTIRGKFWLVADRGSQNETILGYTQEGTINIDREYRDASQNQTVSPVKGLKQLDSAMVSFETSALELDKELLVNFKGLKVSEYIDVIDGTKFAKYTEPAYVEWEKYIDTLDIVFEFNDGKLGVFRMFNVIETASESVTLSRTDDATIAVRFEATIAEGDCDESLPYEWLIEEQTVEDLLEKASASISKTAITINVNVEGFVKPAIKRAVEAALIAGDKDFSVIVANTDASDVSGLIGAAKGTFVKDIEIVLEAEGVSQSALIAVTMLEPVTPKPILTFGNVVATNPSIGGANDGSISFDIEVLGDPSIDDIQAYLGLGVDKTPIGEIINETQLSVGINSFTRPDLSAGDYGLYGTQLDGTFDFEGNPITLVDPVVKKDSKESKPKKEEK